MSNKEPIAVKQSFSKNFSAAGQTAKLRWQNDTLQRRVVSGMWSLDSYDPFQIFQVKHRECNILKVFVDKGYNISKGWLRDLVDKPDPYLILSVPGTPNGKKHTKTIDNDVNPVWQQEFEFYLDPDDIYQLEIVIMDANYTKDGEMDRITVPLNDLEGGAGKDSKDYVATLPKGAKIFLKLELTKNYKPDLRYSLALSDDEKDFLRIRREKVMDGINNLIPEDGPRTTNEVPMIGLLGSGGGFRALVALSGVCTALHDEGIIDCLAYMAGLSGSSWYLSYLYAQPEFPEKTPRDFQPKLKEAISKNWKKLMFTKFIHYSKQLINKKTNGQPVSFTDLFGHLVGETLLGAEVKNSTLSGQRRCLDKGQMPMPLYTCVNVKKNVSARVFQDWFEFSPFEVGIAKYGAFMKPEHFGSKYFVGKIIKQYPEYPLHFLQGVWGSAFCKLIKWHIKGEKDMNLADFTSTSDEVLDDFKTEVQDLINNENRTSAQLEEEIERLSDDEFQDARSEVEQQERDLETEETGSSSEELMSSSEDEEKVFDTPKLERRGAIKQRSKDKKTTPNAPNSWKEKKRAQKAKKREQEESFWNRGLSALFCSDMLDTREGRAGMIFNPLRGLNLENAFDISPFNATTPEDDTDFMGLYEPTNLEAKKLYLVDSGLTFNIPFPLLLRPQRAVDLYLSFDFSTRTDDEEPPFKQLIIAEKWASLNHVPFPPIEKQASKYTEEELKEWYVFDNPEDPQCPTILHFVIYNKRFREYKEPGVKRETQEELDFADFNIFEEETPYSILNFCYTFEQFERLSQLMEFNTRLGMADIKEQIAKAVERRRALSQNPRPPISLSKLPSLKRRAKAKEFAEYMQLRMSMEVFEDAQ